MAYSFPERQESPESQETQEQETRIEELAVPEEATPVSAEDIPAAQTPEALLPPEARGEANGGPLGCCLGTIMGLFLAFALVTVFSIVLASRGGPFITVPAILVGAAIGGYLGWRIGKRVYKEYEPPVVKQRPYRAYPARTQHAKRKKRVEG